MEAVSSIWPYPTTGLTHRDSSDRNRSDIIAYDGLPNAKPSTVDYILPLPETIFRLKINTEPK